MVLRIGGLASGIDTDTLVKQLMEAQRIPLNKIAQKKQLLEWKRDDYRAMNNKILEFRNAAFDMQLQSSYLTKKASSSNDSIISVSGKGSAIDGQYTIKVESLANSAEFSTGKLSGAAGGNVTLANKLGLTGSGNKLTIAGEKSATINLNANDSVDSMINSINEQSSVTGIKAIYDASMDRIFFKSAKTGEKAKIELSLKNGSGTELNINDVFKTTANPAGSKTINVNGTDAKVIFNGLEATYPTNTFEIAGLTFTAKQKSDEVVNIGVSHDVDGVFDKIKNFVEKYNSLIDEINKETTEKRYRDFQPLSDEEREAMSEDEIKRWEEKARSGMLANDQLLSNGLYSLRRALSDSVGGLPTGQLKNLAEIGISNVNIVGKTVTGDYGDRGKLYIDEEKLKKALTENPEEVMALFVTDGETEANDGIATRLYDKASELFKQITEKAGSINSVDDTYSMGKENKRLSEDIERLKVRLADLETRYYKQFTAMESYLNKMNAQSAWLSQQFSS